MKEDIRNQKEEKETMWVIKRKNKLYIQKRERVHASKFDMIKPQHLQIW